MKEITETIGGLLATELPNKMYFRQSDLIPAVIPFSPATLWRKVKNGRFPAPIRLSERVTAWRRCDIVNWLNTIHEGSNLNE